MKHALSPRQVEVMRLLCQGLTDKEVASETGLTVFTVGEYVKQIRIRLHARNRVQAAVIFSVRRTVLIK